LSRKKNLIREVKKNLENKRTAAANNIEALYTEKLDLFSKGVDTTEVDNEIKALCEKIEEVNLALERKDKKSNNLQWSDTSYKPKSKRVNRMEIDLDQLARAAKYSGNTNPDMKWLHIGKLVKTRNRALFGIVLDLKSNGYASVLFGDSEILIKKTALRPAEWS
jgi:hypothetical protein